jgi:hypothetical protein
MKDYIINSFIIQNARSFDSINNYIAERYKVVDNGNKVKTTLKLLLKEGLIVINNGLYELTDEGNRLLDFYKYYFSRTISSYLKKYHKKILRESISNTCEKKYTTKEVRPEQKSLRDFLVNNKEHVCILCDKRLPLCLLETAHLKPRPELTLNEMNDNNVVEFMCRFCHKLYDDGHLSVHNGILHVSQYLNDYSLNYDNYKEIKSYTSENSTYFIFHYNTIYKKNLENIML